MNKVQLIQALKDATDLSKSQAAAVVDIFFNGMADELAIKKLPFFKAGQGIEKDG